MSPGRFVKTLTAVPSSAARFVAVTVTVIGPSGTLLNGKENCQVAPTAAKSSADVRGGAVDSGGRPHCIVSVAGESTASPATVPSMLMFVTSSAAPLGGDVICTSGGCVGTGAGGSPASSRSSIASNALSPRTSSARQMLALGTMTSNAVVNTFAATGFGPSWATRLPSTSNALSVPLRGTSRACAKNLMRACALVNVMTIGIGSKTSSESSRDRSTRVPEWAFGSLSMYALEKTTPCGGPAYSALIRVP